VKNKALMMSVVAMGIVGTTALSQPAPRDRGAPSTAREDALDPSPVDPANDPDIGLFLNDWHNAKPRTAFGGLVFHDILTGLGSADPVKPAARGAVLTAITSVSRATLAPGASASGRARPGERQIFFATDGHGQLIVNGKTHEIKDGVGFTLTPDFDFRLTNSGKTPLGFYVRAEPIPADTKASTDAVVVSRWDGDRRIGAHWVHICNGGPAGMTLCTVAPYTMPQPHSHPGEEVWILVKGESLLSLGKQLINMHPGQAYRIPPTGLAAHSNLNLGSEPIELIYMGPAVRGPQPQNQDYARLDNSPIAPRTAPDVDMYVGNWRDAYPRIAHGNLYMRDMLTALQGVDDLHPTRKGAVLTRADAVSYAMLEPGSTAHPVDGELRGLQETFVVASGSGVITSGTKRIELAKGMSFVVTPDLDFRLTATGDHYLTFYVVTEKAPDGAAARELKVIDHRNAAPVMEDWHDSERPVITKADGLGQYAAIMHVDQPAMTMARPTSAAAGTEEIWIALDDTDMLFGKQLRKIPAGTAYKIPPTGITAHANVDAGTKPTEFLVVR
jgi:mannose-6-phosphate isomerase-like protein (cupin superfamily)